METVMEAFKILGTIFFSIYCLMSAIWPIEDKATSRSFKLGHLLVWMVVIHVIWK